MILVTEVSVWELGGLRTLLIQPIDLRPPRLNGIAMNRRTAYRQKRSLTTDAIHHSRLCPVTTTVQVMPELTSTPSGTLSMWMRVGIRWASRTHSNVGL